MSRRRWNYTYLNILIPTDFGDVQDRAQEAVRLARQRCRVDPDEVLVRLTAGDLCVVRFKRRSIWSGR